MAQPLDQFYLYGLFALVACCLKIAILSAVITRSRLTSAFNLVCIALILQNALEFLSAFLYASNPVLALHVVDGVMFSLYFFAAALVYFCATVAQTRHAPLLTGTCAGFALLVGGLHLSGLLIAGYTPLRYTIISQPGPMYWVFQLYIFSVVLLSLGILLRGAFAAGPALQARCKTSLLAIAPVCALGVGVIILRSLGYNASTAIAMPIASTLFVWILALDQRGEFVTFKVKWRIIFRLAANIRSLKLSTWSDELEKLLVMEALRATKNNKSAAARLLGSNQTTFHRKAEKHLEKAKPASKSPTTATPGPPLRHADPHRRSRHPAINPNSPVKSL